MHEYIHLKQSNTKRCILSYTLYCEVSSTILSPFPASLSVNDPIWYNRKVTFFIKLTLLLSQRLALNPDQLIFYIQQTFLVWLWPVSILDGMANILNVSMSVSNNAISSASRVGPILCQLRNNYWLQHGECKFCRTMCGFEIRLTTL